MFNFFCLIKFLADGRPPDIYRNWRRGWLTTQRHNDVVVLFDYSYVVNISFFVLKREKIRENERVGEAAKIQNTQNFFSLFKWVLFFKRFSIWIDTANSFLNRGDTITECFFVEKREGGYDSFHFCFVLCDPKYGLIIFLIEFKLLPKSADHFIHGDVDYGLLDALR